MSVTLPPPHVSPSGLVEIEDGVIEEARRRHRRRRARGVALGGGAIAIAALGLLIGGAGKGSSGGAGEARSSRPLKLSLVRGRAFAGGQPALMGVTPSLQAGNVGVCVMVVGDGQRTPKTRTKVPIGRQFQTQRNRQHVDRCT